MSSAAASPAMEERATVATMAATAVQASTTADVIRAVQRGRNVGPRMQRTVVQLLGHIAQAKLLSEADGTSNLFDPHTLVLDEASRHEGFARLASSRDSSQLVSSYDELFRLADSVQVDPGSSTIQINDPDRAAQFAALLNHVSEIITDYLRNDLAEADE